MKDALGRELAVGDLIVWPVTYADRIHMRSGKVVQLLDKAIRVEPDARIKTWAYPRGIGKGVFIWRVENVVKVGPCPTPPPKSANCPRCGQGTCPVEWGCPECGPEP